MTRALRNRPLLLRFTIVLLVAALSPAPSVATCGGGGGGGLGGATPNAGGGQPTVYYVPWQVLSPGAPQPDGELHVYWFPASKGDVEGSSLRQSRYLTLSSAQCVGLGVVTNDNRDLRDRFEIALDGASILLAEADGQEVARLPGDASVLDVEKLLRGELDRRESIAKENMKAAKKQQKAGEADSAADLYGRVTAESCLLPSLAKKASKALQKMGREAPEGTEIGTLDLPDLGSRTSRKIQRAMVAGLVAERAHRIEEAQRLYETAHRLDPNDPVPVRFLAELHRHHTGDWKRATSLFEHVLGMDSDRLSRAVALHGLGKMTIHGGGFEAGLARFEESIETFPLALAYRNLAVYWNSEGEHERAYGYVQNALELEPDDAYNQVFAATYLVELGRPSEALEIARQHHGFLEASYNLAAIHAQLGDRKLAFELLRRHFYEYEQFDAVRAKEMREARDDIVFAHYHDDPEFISLTALADDDRDSYHLAPAGR